VTVVEALAVAEIKTKAAAALLRTLGADGKTLVIDVRPDENLSLSVRTWWASGWCRATGCLRATWSTRGG